MAQHLIYNLSGALIHIYGAFFDGQACIVEPLGDPLTMLRDQRGLREQRLSKILTALKLGHDSILHLVQYANYFSLLMQK